jgi:hypothetical protein
MICFDIEINDKHFCRAGVGDDGVLTAAVSWGDAPAEIRGHRKRERRVDLSIGGLRDKTHVDWIRGFRKLSVGDSVTIHIVESKSFDAPSRTETHDVDTQPECAFCGLAENEFRRIVPGPIMSICNECIETCRNYLGAAR